MGRFARRGQVRFPLVREFSGTAGEFSETSGELSDTLGEFSKTFGELSETSGEFSETLGGLSDTLGEFSETFGELSDTLGKFSRVCPHRYDGRIWGNFPADRSPPAQRAGKYHDTPPPGSRKRPSAAPETAVNSENSPGNTAPRHTVYVRVSRRTAKGILEHICRLTQQQTLDASRLALFPPALCWRGLGGSSAAK
jgi:hypothetical protein